MKRLAQVFIFFATLIVAGIAYVVLEQNAIVEWLTNSRYGQTLQDKSFPEDGTKWVRIGAPVPTYHLPGLSGDAPVAIPVAGHWTLVNYWASWCGPCRREMPLLRTIAVEQAGKLHVVGISFEEPGDARAFVAAHPTGYPVAVEWPIETVDSSVPLGNIYGLLPATFLVDPQGRLQHRRIGPFDDADDLRDWLEDGGMPVD
jgi:thiol-disulfide isomerase/thioredoxin